MQDPEALLADLLRENGVTQTEIQRLQARSLKEQGDIEATKRVIALLKGRDGNETVDAEDSTSDLEEQDFQPQPDPSKTAVDTGAVERAKFNLLQVIKQAQPPFTTKDIFPLVPELQDGSVNVSVGYGLMGRLVGEGKLLIQTPGAGRRPAIYTKPGVPPPPKPAAYNEEPQLSDDDEIPF